MKSQIASHHPERGWSPTPLPSSPDASLVLVFGGSAYVDRSEPFAQLQRAYPGAVLVGCSTAGEIVDARIEDDTLAVAIVTLEQGRVRAAQRSIAGSGDSARIGAELARELLAPDLAALFVLSDGLAVNGSELVAGINSVVPSNVVVTGGLAGDGSRFARTWVLHDGSPRTGVLSAVGFYGSSVRVGHGSKGGFDLFGPERRITRSTGNVLYEIDGKPALALYKEYLGERAAGLPATGLLFPIALRASSGAEKSLVRTILAVDEATQSMTFAGDVPTGATVQLMRANFDRLVGGAIEAAEQVETPDAPRGDTLSIAISCVGRRLVLGERAEEEVEGTLQALRPGTRQIGFYSYGELSPYADGSCDLHNQTMTLTTLSEA
ncbi:MAG: FIST C-terminal domain-containing protein [Planctomycetes bacterium]|nr:FIST C-terminal domain-containing protein [Planctomycetota bacterium]